MTHPLWGALQRSITRADFKRNPVVAIWERIWWKLRWRLSNRLWLLKLDNGIPILVPHSGPGALIYYLGHTEPETASFLQRFLQPGMTMIDVGAHFGEYTLRAARIVGRTGRVYAFEPNPDLSACIQQNINLNALENVIVSTTAVADRPGQLSFEIAQEPALSALTTKLSPTSSKSARTVHVEATTLDTLWLTLEKPTVDLIKIDVEGAEYLVFQGANALLQQTPDRAPVLLFEFNHLNYAAFGVTCNSVLEMLTQYGYRFLTLKSQDMVRIVSVEHVLGSDSAPQNIVAAKNPEALLLHLATAGKIV